MVDMVHMDIMERDLLKLRLSQDTSEEGKVMEVMVMVVDLEDMATDVDTMARGRLKLSQDILEDMVDTVGDMDMVVMVMAVDMAIMVKLEWNLVFSAKLQNHE